MLLCIAPLWDQHATLRTATFVRNLYEREGDEEDGVTLPTEKRPWNCDRRREETHEESGRRDGENGFVAEGVPRSSSIGRRHRGRGPGAQ